MLKVSKIVLNRQTIPQFIFVFLFLFSFGNYKMNLLFVPYMQFCFTNYAKIVGLIKLDLLIY